MTEQRNSYKGVDSRAWSQIELVSSDGTRTQLDLIADTGCPFDLIVDVATISRFADSAVTKLGSTYGVLLGAWVHVFIKDIGLHARVLAYGHDGLVREAQMDSPNFAGLIGLPLLRMTEYGGDVDWFWLRPALASGTRNPP